MTANQQAQKDTVKFASCLQQICKVFFFILGCCGMPECSEISKYQTMQRDITRKTKIPLISKQMHRKQYPKQDTTAPNKTLQAINPQINYKGTSSTSPIKLHGTPKQTTIPTPSPTR
jgi:hypothetical protein